MASLPTLEEIKTALGIESSDVSKDESIQSMLEATIAIVETYLRRGIAQQSAVEEFPPPDSRKNAFALFRYPVDHINSITQEAVTISGWRLSKKSGVVQWPDGCCIPHRACCGEDDIPLVIDYVGGYPDDEWPADLVEAVMRAFYVRWDATGGTGNLAEVVNSPGANRSVTVDGLTITRDSQMYAGEAFKSRAIPPELVSVASMLEPYRSRIVAGV